MLCPAAAGQQLGARFVPWRDQLKLSAAEETRQIHRPAGTHHAARRDPLAEPYEVRQSHLISQGPLAQSQGRNRCWNCSSPTRPFFSSNRTQNDTLVIQLTLITAVFIPYPESRLNRKMRCESNCLARIRYVLKTRWNTYPEKPSKVGSFRSFNVTRIITPNNNANPARNIYSCIRSFRGFPRTASIT